MAITAPRALLDALRDVPFVVVHAPAGFGKTTALREALTEGHVAWYDARPWERDAFVDAFVATVRTQRPDAGRLTLALAADGAPADRLAATLADELRHVDAPLRIVVDGADVLGPAFDAFVRVLAQRMPGSVRLVVAAREPLDVALPEAVAAGRGALIDADALRFDVERTRALAASLGAALDDAGAAALVRRTEGWPLAIALALRTSSDVLLDELVGRRIDALEGADRALLDATLAYELIEPAIVEHDHPGAGARIAALARDPTLAARAGDAFRVHPLVRESLARRLDAPAIAARHAEAARAYTRANRVRPALFHLERASDPDADAMFLRTHAAAAIASGALDGVRGALVRVRDARDRSDALLSFVEGLLAKARGDDARAFFTHAVRDADACDDASIAFAARVEQVEADLARGDAVDEARIADLLARAHGRGAHAAATATIRAGWADAVAGRFGQALARLDAVGDGGDAALRADLAPLQAYAHLALGEFEDAERVTNALVETWSASDDIVRYGNALVWAARFALVRGETTAAYEWAREAERIMRPFTLRPNAAALHVTLAEAALQVGDDALARREARAAQRVAGAAWYARDVERTRTLAARLLARADALNGDARAALAASGDEGDALALADAAVFAALDERADAPARREAARRALGAARPVDAADAVALLGAAELLDFLDALDGHDVVTAVPSGPFASLLARRTESVRLADLGRALRTGRLDAFAAGMRTAAERGERYETRIAARFGHAPAPIAAADGQIEPLTARESEILVLLAAGLTNREIAQRLVLSARTVETHVARITGKLGVNSRARAVARAVALRIVPAGAVP